MNHLLHLDSSLRTEGSRSRKLSAHYADAGGAKHPGGTVTYRDLAADPVPHLDNARSANFVAATTARPSRSPPGRSPSSSRGRCSPPTRSSSELPLYNFGPPSTFKAWLDRIVVPDLTFGQLADTEMVVVTARGGGYGPGTPREGWDHREPWLRHALSPRRERPGLHRHRTHTRPRVPCDGDARPRGRRGQEPR